jgi:hypothetical protein
VWFQFDYLTRRTEPRVGPVVQAAELDLTGLPVQLGRVKLTEPNTYVKERKELSTAILFFQEHILR